VKREWNAEEEEEVSSLSRHLHQLIQESPAKRKQGRLKLGNRRKVVELEQEVDELQPPLENRKHSRSIETPHQ